MDNNKSTNNNPKSLTLFDTIIKYPFSGRSKYLIDKFYIIGYDNTTLNKLLIKTNIKDLINKNKTIDEDDNIFINLKKGKNNNILYSIIVDEPPSLLNEITSDHNKPILNIDLIISLIFPHKAKIYYYIEKKEKSGFDSRSTISSFSSSSTKSGNSKYKNNTINNFDSYNVIFSSNPQEKNNSKKSTNGFAHIFYNSYDIKKSFGDNIITFFVPTAFCIISEFPFFNSYYLLCNKILNLFQNKKLEIPLEIILYNIVNSCLSPINGDVYLNLELFSNSYERVRVKSELNIEINDSIKKEESSDDLLNINIDDNIKYDSQKNLICVKKKLKNEKIVEEKKENLYRRCQTITNLDNTYSFSRISLLQENLTKISDMPRSSIIKNFHNKYFDDIKFECLSGYPLIQYNLAKVLFKMEPKDIITIFIYTFLEKTVIFFSKNIELLSLTINSYLNLNFPLNDEKYYFFNACTSLENYMNGNSYFVGTSFTSIIGINDKYNPKYLENNNVKLSEHLVVDLDKGVTIKVKNENSEEEEDEILFKFLKKIFGNKEINTNSKMTILYRKIKYLYRKLYDYKKLFSEKNNSNKDQIEFKNVINGDYIDYDDHEYLGNSRRSKVNNENNSIIKKMNFEIQDSFYTLVNYLCMYFYQNLSLKLNSNNNKNLKKKLKKEKELMKVMYNKNIENKYTKEEIAFLKELRTTMKFQSFVYGFIQSYNPIDLYKIPLSFTEEFLSILTRKNINKYNLPFLSIINSLYRNKTNRTTYIEYNKLINDDYLKVRNFIDREIYDQFINNKSKNIIDVKTQNDGTSEVIDFFEYKKIELNNDILFKYKNCINNLNNKEYAKLFYYNHYLNENQIKTIVISEIESEIEKYLMKINVLTKYDICFSNIILLFIMSIQSNINKFNCQIFLSNIFQQFTIFRKYYSMIISVLYRLTKICIKEKNYELAIKYCLCYYPCINSLCELQLVPNEILMALINKFDEIDLDYLSQKSEENSQKNDNNNNNDKEKDENLVFKSEYIYVVNNFNKKGFYKEKTIVDKCNSSFNNSNTFVTKHKNKIRQPKIKFNNGVFKYECRIINQYKILEILSRQYLVFQSLDLNINLLDARIIFDSCLNISLFIRNNEIFKGKEELINLFNQIFTVYLNLLYRSISNN